MCNACDRQERVCPQGHVQAKHHGDVFRESNPCKVCGRETTIRERKDS